MIVVQEVAATCSLQNKSGEDFRPVRIYADISGKIVLFSFFKPLIEASEPVIPLQQLFVLARY